MMPMSTEELLPKLRFNGFDDEWSTYKLSELSEQVKRKKENITDKDNILTISANKGFISQKERWDNVIAGKSLKKYTYLKKDEFSYNRGNSKSFKYGCIYRLNYENALVPNVYHSFKITNGNINFFEQLFKSKLLDKQLIKIITSTARMDGLLNISAKNFFNIDVNIPNNLEEQKLIGDFLKLIDIKIELLENKYENYLNFKKYLMQQIFAQKLRFDFDDEWKTMRLNEIVFYQEGPGVRNYQYTKSGVKLLNVGNFVNNVLELDNTDRYISEEEAYGKYNHFLVDEGDLLIACSGIKAEYFDEKIAFAEKKHLPLCMNTSTMRFKSLDENLLNLNYLKCYFQTESFKKQVFSVMTGSAQFNFGPTHLKYFKIPIPSIDEQKQIYELIGPVDNKISMINRELVKVNEFKKALLQQMFV